jgi:hypothetical protein
VLALPIATAISAAARARAWVNVFMFLVLNDPETAAKRRASSAHPGRAASTGG